VRAVTIGNNHIYNFGQNGLRSTEKYLRDAGVGYFGGISGNEPVYRLNTHGLRLSFVSYNQFGGSSSQAVAEVVASERALGRQVIVFAHWGVEYETSTATTAPLARMFAQNGASLVIGAHPHVVGPSERIGNTLVYYSLGNFIFDQYFSEAVQRGLAVLVTLGPSGVVGVEEHPVTISIDGATCAR
jgi:poly-gamma-glutamate synthesis protein (capsule biosynthesis protein)